MHNFPRLKLSSLITQLSGNKLFSVSCTSLPFVRQGISKRHSQVAREGSTYLQENSISA